MKRWTRFPPDQNQSVGRGKTPCPQPRFQLLAAAMKPAAKCWLAGAKLTGGLLVGLLFQAAEDDGLAKFSRQPVNFLVNNLDDLGDAAVGFRRENGHRILQRSFQRHAACRSLSPTACHSNSHAV